MLEESFRGSILPNRRILVCGDRNWDDRDLIFDTLDEWNKLYNLTIIHGGAKGADSMAGEWAIANHCPLLVFYADWHIHGRAAGPIRNKRMLEEGRPDEGFVFHNNFSNSSGSKDMARRLMEAGLPVTYFQSVGVG